MLSYALLGTLREAVSLQNRIFFDVQLPHAQNGTSESGVFTERICAGDLICLSVSLTYLCLRC